MKAKLVRIGNSRGVRLPKPLIEQAGLSEDVELEIRDGGIVITSATTRRAGWEEAARSHATSDDGELLDDYVPTQFDEEEWAW